MSAAYHCFVGFRSGEPWNQHIRIFFGEKLNMQKKYDNMKYTLIDKHALGSSKSYKSQANWFNYNKINPTTSHVC